MRGFRKLVMLGVLLVTLLLVIDTIDAGKKHGKKKELETGKSFDQEHPKFTSKSKHTEHIKIEKSKRSPRSVNYEDEYKYRSKDAKFDWKTGDGKKNMKMASKDKKYTDNEKSKTSKQYENLKKSLFLEEPEENFDSSKIKMKKTKAQYMRSGDVDRVIKSTKKNAQKKLFQENEDSEKILTEELDRMKNEETISVEESVGGSSKKKKYRLVEVVLEEDQQDDEQEGNDTTSESGSDRDFFNIEREETTEKTRWTHNPNSYKNKKSSKKYNPLEEEQNDEPINENDYIKITEEIDDPKLSEEKPSDVDSYASKYTDPVTGSCQRLPEDPNRKGPKKLTLYVIEEEVNGQIKKRVVSEEDGVTMCEVADLLKEAYFNEMPEE